jgi:hypothetical protein
MEREHQAHQATVGPSSFWTSRSGFVLLAFLAMGGVLLITEHAAHALGLLPFLFILACPLLHIFGHRGHGDHGAHSQSEGRNGPEVQTRQGRGKIGDKS